MDNKKEVTKEVLLNTGREREIESAGKWTVIDRLRSEQFTCGVKAKMRSLREYNLLVLRMPTSRDLRPLSPSFRLRPR